MRNKNQHQKLKSHVLIEFLTLESSASQENYARLQNDVYDEDHTLYATVKHKAVVCHRVRKLC